MSNCNFCKYAQKKIDELGVKLHKADSIWQAQEKRIDELEAQRKQSNIEINDLKLDNFQLKCAFDDKCDELREVKAQLAEIKKAYIGTNLFEEFGFGVYLVLKEYLEEKEGE